MKNINLKESEISDIVSDGMNTESLIKKHERCIEILYAIKYFEERKKNRIESIDGFAGLFPELKQKYINNIDIINRCIKRLIERYNRIAKIRT
jgi:hypothetical protein